VQKTYTVIGHDYNTGPENQCLKYGGITAHLGSDKLHLGSDKLHLGSDKLHLGSDKTYIGWAMIKLAFTLCSPKRQTSLL